MKVAFTTHDFVLWSCIHNHSQQSLSMLNARVATLARVNLHIVPSGRVPARYLRWCCVDVLLAVAIFVVLD